MVQRLFMALVCACVLSLFGNAAFAAAPSAPTLTPENAAAISAARRSVITLQETAERGTITRAQADEACKPYLAAASKAMGHNVTASELVDAPDPAPMAGAAPEGPGLMSRIFTLANLGLVFAALIGVLCFGYLAIRFIPVIAAYLKEIPLVIYEFLFYGVSVALMAYGKLGVSPENGPYVGLVGALLFIPAMLFSIKLRKTTSTGAGFSLVLCVAWTIATFVYGSSILGFIAVAALLSTLGFSIIVSPLCYGFGFKDDTSIGRATSAAFMILGFFVVMRWLLATVSLLKPFEFGALFIGSFVGYLGLLISSSRWYTSKRSYAYFQLVTIAAGVLALVVGSLLDVGPLLKIGGTFFGLYLIEKIAEIPAKSKTGYAMLGLVIAGLLFGASSYVKTNADVIRPYVFGV